LLSAEEGAPFEVLERDGPSPFFIVCDHAGRLIPRALGSLGLSEDELARHIAWDIGAAGVARRLAAALAAHTVLQRFSRLTMALSEGQVGWIPFILERLDSVWADRPIYGNIEQLTAPPSTYMRDRVYGWLSPTTSSPSLRSAASSACARRASRL